MKHSTFALLLGSTLSLGLLSGCAVDKEETSRHQLGATYRSAVKTLPNGQYFVEVEAAPLAGRQSGADTVATEKATQHCAQRQQKMTVVNKVFDSHLLVNGVVRLTFKCE